MGVFTKISLDITIYTGAKFTENNFEGCGLSSEVVIIFFWKLVA
jgi:hypothetical protein